MTLNDASTDIEENTGVEFPGLQFDVMLNKTYREVDRTHGSSFSYYYDLIVVEVKAEGGNFIFRYNKNPGQLGKCEGCYGTLLLKEKCRCEKVFYCSA